MLRADGGALQWKSHAGPFAVSVFTAPVPLRVGPADISVLVERAEDHSVVLDADVVLRLSSLTVNATRAAATNKIMYAAEVSLPSGNLDVELTVRSSIGRGTAHGRVEVLPPERPLGRDWPYFAVVPACLLLFILNQLLKARSRKV
jgi:hypothetical protein